MGSKDLKEVVAEAFLIALDEKLDKRNTYTNRDIGDERREFKRAGIPLKKVAKGRGVTLPNLKGVKNTDAEDFDADTTQGKMKQWARTMQTNKTDEKKGKKSKKVDRVIPSKEDRKKSRDQRRAVHTQVKNDTDRPSAISTEGKGNSTLQAGNTRASLRRALGKPIKAHMFKEQIKNAVLNYLEESEKAGRKLTQARQQGKLKPGKLSKEDYEAGHASHPAALRNRIRTSIADKAGRKASDKETDRLSKHQDIGGSVAAHHLTHGIKKSLEKDPSQGEGSDASKRTIDIAPMRSRRAHPQSGSMAQLDKHQKMARKRGEVAATQSTEDFHAGEEAAGATLNPKQASKAARSRTRTAAGEVRTAKHQAAQGTGAKTTKSSKNPAIRNAVRDEDRNTRDRRNTYGDTKQGYKDSTDFDPMNPFKEQIKNAVLNYLKEDDAQPPSAQGKRASFYRTARRVANRNTSWDPTVAPNNTAQAKARTKQILARKRHGAGGYAPAGSRSGAQADSERVMRQADKRWQRGPDTTPQVR